MPHQGHVEFQTDQAGETRWRIRAANGQVIADSGEGYTDPADAEHGLMAAFGVLAGTGQPTAVRCPLEYLTADGEVWSRIEP